MLRQITSISFFPLCHLLRDFCRHSWANTGCLCQNAAKGCDRSDCCSLEVEWVRSARPPARMIALCTFTTVPSHRWPISFTGKSGSISRSCIGIKRILATRWMVWVGSKMGALFCLCGLHKHEPQPQPQSAWGNIPTFQHSLIYFFTDWSNKPKSNRFSALTTGDEDHQTPTHPGLRSHLRHWCSLGCSASKLFIFRFNHFFISLATATNCNIYCIHICTEGYCYHTRKRKGFA